MGKIWSWDYETTYYHIYCFDSDYVMTFDGPQTEAGDLMAQIIVNALNANVEAIFGPRRADAAGKGQNIRT